MIEDEGWLYLEPSDILAVAEEFGLPGLRDASILEATCARVRQSVAGVSAYDDLPAKAGALGWGLASTQALIDGNKRIAAIATLYFCLANGFDLAITQEELVALFLQIARGELDQDEFVAFLRSRITLA